MNVLTLKVLELVIASVTSAIQFVMALCVIPMICLLVLSIGSHNVRVNRVACGTYVTDSTRGWIEVVNKNDNSRIATITIDCTHNTIESIK